MTMEINVSVSEAMSSPVETVNLNTTCYDAANILRTKGIGCLIVVNDLLKPVGIITERDLVLKIVARNLKSKEVLISYASFFDISFSLNFCKSIIIP